MFADAVRRLRRNLPVLVGQVVARLMLVESSQEPGRAGAQLETSLASHT